MWSLFAQAAEVVDPEILPPLLFPAATSTERRTLAALKAAGRIRSIGPRLYASVPPAEVARAVRAQWTAIVRRLFPAALISHRSALEFTPGPSAEIIITSTTHRAVAYPGLTLTFVRGPAPLAEDPRFAGIRCSSEARAYLENLLPRRRTTMTHVLAADELEVRLDALLRVRGEDALNALRDHARAVAGELGWHAPFAKLDRMIGGLLGTRTADLRSAVARARFAGAPFDPRCVERLQLLATELRARPLPELADTFDAPDHATNKAFFEAYFSNFIEGTRFELDEAEAIVFDHQLPDARPKDAHDILGTWIVVSDPTEMRRVPRDPDEMVALIQQRHATMLRERPEVSPGVFKTRPNRAGDTQFVAPALVRGTLEQAWPFYESLPPGLARAIFMMFVVSDVHPFDDGNGRIARIMMNAELVAAERTTIIIPTVFRDDYINALRALTRRHRAAPLVDALVKAQLFSRLPFAPYPDAVRELTRRNWFREPDAARIVT